MRALLRTTRRAVVAVLAVGMVAGMLASAAPATATPVPPQRVLVVTNTNDSGPGSLRSALETAGDVTVTTYTILFDIPAAGVQVISPLTALPSIGPNVTVDGYSQPGAAPAGGGATAVLLVQIDAPGLSHGLHIAGYHSVVRGLVVTGADASGGGTGIGIDGNDNVVAGNYVGVTPDGEQAAANSSGVVVRGDRNLIGGDTTADRNVISANEDGGVVLTGDDNVVAGNRLGTDDDGTTDLGNGGTGVQVQGSANTVGGSSPSSRNLISGNSNGGVFVEDAGPDNEVLGNFVGTNASGNGPLGNDEEGIQIHAADAVVSGNVIAGNLQEGLSIEADRVKVLKNKIGTNAAGNAALPNGYSGIYIEGSDTEVGGAGRGNVISANLREGILIMSNPNDPSKDNVVRGNRIGTNAAGNAALGNAEEGIVVEGLGSRIGGGQPGEGNLVSGNGGSGLFVDSDGNRLEGNRIGTDAAGSGALPNLAHGIAMSGEDNLVTGNTIAFNVDDGVTVDSGVGNTLTNNSISANGGLGIDLAPGGAETNDPLDVDNGANDLLNHPVVAAASTVGGVTRIYWKIGAGLPSTDQSLEFFTSPACDTPGGNGEGQRLLGSVLVRTDAFGNATGYLNPPGTAPTGWVVTATATIVEQKASLDLGSTSEFSACRTVT